MQYEKAGECIPTNWFKKWADRKISTVTNTGFLSLTDTDCLYQIPIPVFLCHFIFRSTCPDFDCHHDKIIRFSLKE